MTHTITVTSRRGTTQFETDLDPRDQATIFNTLDDLLSKEEIADKNKNFVLSLINGYRRYRSWKPNQVNWALLQIEQVKNPQNFQSGNPEPVSGMRTILQHIQDATEHLKRPTIILEVEDGTIVLKLNTAGRRPGTVAVSSSTRYGGSFYGYIDLDTFEPRQGTPGYVTSTLKRVAVDPARVISEIGRESGRCCYCPASLTQVQSKIAGCGKTCAENYSVEYPNAARTREIVADHPEYLTGATDAERWTQTTSIA